MVWYQTHQVFVCQWFVNNLLNHLLNCRFLIMRHTFSYQMIFVTASLALATGCEDAGTKAVRLRSDRDIACAAAQSDNWYQWTLDSMAGGRYAGQKFTPEQEKRAGLDTLLEQSVRQQERCAKATRAYNKFMR